MIDLFVKEGLIEELKKENVVCKMQVELKHAGQSDVYFDIKKAYGNPQTLSLISHALWQRLDKKITAVAACGYGGISPATIIGIRYGVKLTLIRDEPKARGTNKLIEGYEPTNKDLVALIDDVCTTGKSFQTMIDILKPTGAAIAGCYCVLKRAEVTLSVPINHILVPTDLI